MLNNLTFIIGGTRSGKSDFAISLAIGKNKKNVIYIATMENKDAETNDRINKHKKNRPKNWITIEAAINVEQAIAENSKENTLILLDCLTLYLSNLMFEKKKNISLNKILKKVKDVIKSIKNCNAEIIIVSNEVGQGIVPDNFPARQFRDIQGTANQYFAKAAKDVYMVVAGIPIKIK